MRVGKLISKKELIECAKIEARMGWIESARDRIGDIERICKEKEIEMERDIIDEILQIYKAEGIQFAYNGAIKGAENYARIRDREGMNRKLRTLKGLAWQRGVGHRIKAVGTVHKVRKTYRRAIREQDEKRAS